MLKLVLCCKNVFKHKLYYSNLNSYKNKVCILLYILKHFFSNAHKFDSDKIYFKKYFNSWMLFKIQLEFAQGFDFRNYNPIFHKKKETIYNPITQVTR